MKDVRIVIVSWNVERLLERCLRSLPGACAGLDWECVVVDNASRDNSVALAQRIAHQIPHIRVIANTTNDGFAKACNAGAHGHTARYVLFLNPDTECLPNALATLVHVADERPKAGIFGAKYTIHAPLISLSKREIIQWGMRLGVDYAATLSCYRADAEGRACGKCDSCRLRKQGFADAGIADPTRYIPS